MLRNSPVYGMPMVGFITGASQSCAMRTAFGDPSSQFNFVFNEYADANAPFPDSVLTDVGEAPLGFNNLMVVYLAVSRLVR